MTAGIYFSKIQLSKNQQDWNIKDDKRKKHKVNNEGNKGEERKSGYILPSENNILSGKHYQNKQFVKK